MIDALDKQTQALPFEPVKRGRGRPKTGSAMTPAEKQRAYRERQKAAAGNVTENTSTHTTGSIELLRERALSRGRTCVAQKRVIEELEKRITELEAQLASRTDVTEKDSLRGVWVIESKRPRSRTWKPCGNPETNLKDARDSVDYMQFKSGSGQAEEWRAMRADGLIYWPLWSKAKAAK